MPLDIDNDLKDKKISKQTKEICFTHKFNFPILPGQIPNTITLIDFNWSTFDQKLEVGSLPPTLKSLRWNGRKKYSFPFSKGVLPDSLEELSLPDYQFNITPDTLPPNLKSITIPDNYKHKIEKGSLPHALKTLIFNSYNQDIPAGVLPDSLQHLVTPNHYTGTIEILPPGLQTLELNYTNNIGKDFFPAGLREISLIDFKSKLSSGILPDNLEKLDIFYQVDVSKLDNDFLPPKLKKLIISHLENKHLNWNLPDSIEELKFNNPSQNHLCDKWFPKNLKQLTITSYLDKEIKKNTFPNTLEILILECWIRTSIGKGVFPPNLKELQFQGHVEHWPGTGVLPSSLEKLKIGGNGSNPPVFEKGIFPKKLVELEIPLHVSCSFPEGALPTSLKKLYVCAKFLKKSKLVLPPNLEELDINIDALPPLPKTLRKLRIHGKYKNDMDLCDLVDLEEVELPNAVCKIIYDLEKNIKLKKIKVSQKHPQYREVWQT